MRAFKKLMAGMIATAIAATLATSAFAAELTEAGKVAVTADEFTAAGQTTVLIVPAAAWESETPLAGLTDADILYIDQYEDAATANAAIVAGFGVKLNSEGTLADGKYYALFGSKSGDDFAITDVAFEVKAAGSGEEEPEEPDVPATKTIQLGDCNLDTFVNGLDITAILYDMIDLEKLSGDGLIAADCNQDTYVNGLDITAVLYDMIDLEKLGTVEVPVGE